MGEEIKSQIQAIVQSSSSSSNLSSSGYSQHQQQCHHAQNGRNNRSSGRSFNKPQHFTFDDSILDDLDFIPSLPNHHNEKEEVHHQHQQHFHHPCTQKQPQPYPSSSTQCHNATNERQTASSLSLLRSQIKKLEDQLSDKQTELKLQKEKSVKALKDCEQQYRDKNQVDRLHFENSQRLMKHAHDEEMNKLKQEMAQVKSDARLIIDFVRRKANEAIQEESHKMEHQKRSIGKKMEALESQMQKTFHNHLHNLEQDVKMVMRKEKKAINLSVLPPPPPKNIAIIPNKRKMKFDFKKDESRSFPTDETKTPDLRSNDSISTFFSDSDGGVQSNEKSGCISNEHELLKTRVKELEQWTDTLTLALRSGAKVTN